MAGTENTREIIAEEVTEADISEDTVKSNAFLWISKCADTDV